MSRQDAEVLWAALYEYRKGWELRQHFHDYFQMIYIVSGNGIFYLDGQEYTIMPGMLFLMKPGKIHGLVNSNSFTLNTLDIKFLLQDPGLLNMLDAAPNTYCFTDGGIMHLFEKIRQEGMVRNAFFKDLSRVYLLQMLYMLLRLGKEENTSMDQEEEIAAAEPGGAGDRIVEYVKMHYKDDISLEVISQSLGYNKSYICQVFRKKYDYTPMKFLYSYRIEKARELMIYSDYSLKQVAEMTGFKSIHHFSRVFHMLEGMTPGQWCKRERDGISKDIYINENFTNTVNTYKKD